MTGDLPEILPGILAEIEEICDRSTAIQLADRLGGTRQWIPHKPRESTPIAAVIGVPAAMVLAATYGGDRVDIPVLRELKHLRRRGRAEGLRAQRYSVPAIARIMGITERQVYNLLTPTADSDQLDMFPG